VCLCFWILFFSHKGVVYIWSHRHWQEHSSRFTLSSQSTVRLNHGSRWQVCQQVTVTVEALRQQLSIIPQDPAMFQGTLRLNLDPFREYTDQQVRTVINQVGLNETRDMHSTVEVSGDDWSLGEKQLVSS